MLDKIVDGRTDLVFEYLAQGRAANSADANGVSLIKWCAYYGDVTAVKHLLAKSPLHAALCKDGSPAQDRVVKILLANGANPNSVTKPGVATGAFMRDCRTRGETPLHRAAAFGSGESIQLLLDAGALKNAKDVNGDSPLAWASWHLRPDAILRKLCYGNFSIRDDRAPMEINLLGEPHV